jgi:hypothetical protein
LQSKTGHPSIPASKTNTGSPGGKKGFPDMMKHREPAKE